MFNLVKHWKLIILVINVIIFSLSAFTSAEPLNDAAKEGDLDGVKRLIEEGANIEVRDASSSTPLYNAVDGGHRDVAKFLILKGANVNVNCENGNTPLHRATVLFGGDKEMAELLIKNGANVNAVTTVVGDTPLHFAAWMGITKMVEFLIANGADVNAVNIEKATPLQMAERVGSKDIMELLVKHGGHK